MNTANVIIHWETMGITQKALKALRNELCLRFRNSIEVYMWSQGGITCGYLIYDHTLNEIVLIGDGFRTDGGGEGGAGYRSAEVLFSLFGLQIYEGLDIPPPKYPVLIEGEEERNRILEEYHNKLRDCVTSALFNEDSRTSSSFIIKNQTPQYIR